MRKLQFKFPNQIRISGWDFGSSARAMNQAGGFISTQADLEKVSRSTTERKSMSTKTTIKRIALVAVSALGLGLLSVVPSKAVPLNATAVTVGTPASARVGGNVIIPVTFTLPSSIVAGTDTVTVNAQITAAPTSGGLSNAPSALLVNSANSSSTTRLYGSDKYGTSIGSQTSNTTAITAITGNAVATWVGNLASSGAAGLDADASGSAAATQIYLTAATDIAGGTATVYFTVKPDLAGSYSVLFSVPTSAAGASDTKTQYTAGDASQSITFTTQGAPATVTAVAQASGVTSGSAGVLVKVDLKDAAGNATDLAGLEALNITSSDTTASFKELDGTTITALSKDHFVNGTAWFRVLDTTEGSTIVTLTGSGSLSSSVTTNFTASFTDVVKNGTTIAANGYTDFELPAASALVTTGARAAATYTRASTTRTYYVPAGSSGFTFTLPLETAATAAIVGYVTVTDTGKSVYSNTNSAASTDPASYDLLVSAAKAATYVSVTVPGTIAAGKSVTVVVPAATASLLGSTSASGTGAAYTVTVTGEVRGTGANSSSNTISVTPAAIRSANGGTNVFTATLKDQFGSAIANGTLSVSVTGRNTSAAATTLITNASGQATFTLVDAKPTSATLTDTVSFAQTNSTTVTRTITYGTVTAGTVTVEGGSTDDVAPAVTYSNIAAGTAGPHGGAVAMTATVKDAAGNVMSGIPVTFSVDKGLIQKTATVDYTTVYTGVDGTATTYVLGWVNGVATVTATAGGKSGTGTITWKSGTTTANAQAAARVLSGSVSGDIVSLKVVDRFGNPVANAVVDLTRTGTGLFGDGKSSTSATTDDAGTADVRFVGTGTVTAKLSASYTQAYAAADKVAGGTATPVAFTAPVAGTTVGTGSTFAPAGVSSVSLDVADNRTDSIDAANDAVEAANAATDAANAAAEAADAATAAAQDAQAAVADLAAQVATLISGIKAQITRLTNLVIKIQKKVNA